MTSYVNKIVKKIIKIFETPFPHKEKKGTLVCLWNLFGLGSKGVGFLRPAADPNEAPTVKFS